MADTDTLDAIITELEALAAQSSGPNPNYRDLEEKLKARHRLINEIQFCEHTIEQQTGLIAAKNQLKNRLEAEIYNLMDRIATGNTTIRCPRFFDFNNVQCDHDLGHDGQHHCVDLDGREHEWAST